MDEKYVVIVAEGCPHCDFAVEYVKSMFKGKKVEVRDVTVDDEAAKIMMELNEFRIPIVVRVEKKNGKTRICLLDDEMKVEKCIDI